MKIAVVQQGILGKTADAAMYPLMQWLSKARDEVPQRTHVWNSVKFPLEAKYDLWSDLLVSPEIDPTASERYVFGVPVFHMPRFGGWKHYVVLESWRNEPWYVGWITESFVGLSKVTLTGPVRVLRGPRPVLFFGLDGSSKQILVCVIGQGTIGDGGPYATLPLL